MLPPHRQQIDSGQSVCGSDSGEAEQCRHDVDRRGRLVSTPCGDTRADQHQGHADNIVPERVSVLEVLVFEKLLRRLVLQVRLEEVQQQEERCVARAVDPGQGVVDTEAAVR